MASGTGLMDQRTCEWDQELLEAVGVDVAQLPEIASDHQTFYKLSSSYAQRWPQLSEARMFPAIADGAANNIGAGCSTREKAALDDRNLRRDASSFSRAATGPDSTGALVLPRGSQTRGYRRSFVGWWFPLSLD